MLVLEPPEHRLHTSQRSDELWEEYNRPYAQTTLLKTFKRPHFDCKRSSSSLSTVSEASTINAGQSAGSSKVGTKSKRTRGSEVASSASQSTQAKLKFVRINSKVATLGFSICRPHATILTSDVVPSSQPDESLSKQSSPLASIAFERLGGAAEWPQSKADSEIEPSPLTSLTTQEHGINVPLIERRPESSSDSRGFSSISASESDTSGDASDVSTNQGEVDDDDDDDDDDDEDAVVKKAKASLARLAEQENDDIPELPTIPSARAVNHDSPCQEDLKTLQLTQGTLSRHWGPLNPDDLIQYEASPPSKYKYNLRDLVNSSKQTSTYLHNNSVATRYAAEMNFDLEQSDDDDDIHKSVDMAAVKRVTFIERLTSDDRSRKELEKLVGSETDHRNRIMRMRLKMMKWQSNTSGEPTSPDLSGLTVPEREALRHLSKSWLLDPQTLDASIPFSRANDTRQTFATVQLPDSRHLENALVDVDSSKASVAFIACLVKLAAYDEASAMQVHFDSFLQTPLDHLLSRQSDESEKLRTSLLAMRQGDEDFFYAFRLLEALPTRSRNTALFRRSLAKQVLLGEQWTLDKSISLNSLFPSLAAEEDKDDVETTEVTSSPFLLLADTSYVALYYATKILSFALTPVFEVSEHVAVETQRLRELIKSLRRLHVSIEDTRAAFPDRTRAKELVQGLAMRLGCIVGSEIYNIVEDV